MKPKCHTVEVPKETTVEINYEAPDIDTDTDSNSYAPSYITVTEKPIETLEEHRAIDGESLEARRRNLLDPSKHKIRPVSQELKEASGSFLHTTHTEDAVLELCIRASGASSEDPMLFHVRVEEMEEDVLDVFEQEKKEGMRAPLVGAEHHWSFLETQLDRIEHEVHTIINEADFFRERDALYHQQTDDLNKATMFWPMLHCCILVLTGFTQANHIINFFKQRRII
eukprot:CAMPEP_0172394914 /NCGR_PEP_ID=MMETSP1061-20121228/17101_1 /TAXON_ID=37318 /ORGANISM="Pseudo-nitzschia pungens, Strain cf. pungens" /LENGTH=225 /DNA_ID=CAMNT_0013126371 /DNA_START=203 /DNA_END=880 /DNA_ORIENTATION=+